jgi:ribosomal protein L5
MLIGLPVVRFNGIDPSFLDAAFERNYEELSDEQKIVFVTKVVEVVQYLREHQQLNPEQFKTCGTFACGFRLPIIWLDRMSSKEDALFGVVITSLMALQRHKHTMESTTCKLLMIFW